MYMTDVLGYGVLVKIIFGSAFFHDCKQSSGSLLESLRSTVPKIAAT